ncbi:MAG: hypothetical protein KJ915_00905 [Candidatus Omnitrophica bacterium]|nr:hypothetical protein [Candidatus Omnitrophota bacterium]
MKRNIQTKNLSKKMNDVFPADLILVFKKIGEIADEKGVLVYIVGGFVRDFLIGRYNFDIDIVIVGDAVDFARNLEKNIGGQLKTYPRFKTAKIKLDNGLIIDIASARTESYAYYAALPVVELSSLDKDLYRRDFTVNTLVISLNKKTFGILSDYFNGFQDLKEKRIRVLHDLSFLDDPTRILRAVRFEQRLNFTIDSHTENLISQAVNKNIFGKLSKMRIKAEFVLCLSEPDPVKVIRRICELDQLDFMHHKIKFTENRQLLFKSAGKAIGWYKANVPGQTVQAWRVYLLVLLDGLSVNDCNQFFHNFGFKKNEQDFILKIKKTGNRILRSLQSIKLENPSQIYEVLSDVSREECLFLMAKCTEKSSQEMFIKYLMKYVNIRLEISGDDLKQYNIMPGPNYKKILKKTLYAKLDGKLSTKEAELGFAKNNI